jgi:hypothetical protein
MVVVIRYMIPTDETAVKNASFEDRFKYENSTKERDGMTLRDTRSLHRVC